MEQSDLFPLDIVQNMLCGTACSKVYSLKLSYSAKACVTETVDFLTIPDENHPDKLHKHTDLCVGHLTMLYEEHNANFCG
jgi:hypothetical protein